MESQSFIIRINVRCYELSPKQCLHLGVFTCDQNYEACVQPLFHIREKLRLSSLGCYALACYALGLLFLGGRQTSRGDAPSRQSKRFWKEMRGLWVGDLDRGGEPEWAARQEPKVPGGVPWGVPWGVPLRGPWGGTPGGSPRVSPSGGGV